MKMETLFASADLVTTPTNSHTNEVGSEHSGSTSLAHLALHQFLLDMVALVYEVELPQLLSPTRGRKKIAFARQVAMYLAHTGGGLSLSCVGRMFNRDRTTVAHACALVEDARDEAVFDRTLNHLESAIACQMDLFRLSTRAQETSVTEKREH
jgi:chromosomal replication initiation ATPase DnaA